MSERACPSSADLSRFVLGTLPEAALEEVARHLDRCPSCEAAVKALEQVSDPVLAAIRHPPSGAASATGRPTAAATPLPERLGDFRLVREIGRGGMGVVYEAEQVSLGRRVALKVLPRHALLDPDAVARFRRESRAAARLHHTNIVQVFGVGEQDGLHYFVMQLIPGVGLDVLVRDLKRLRTGPAPTAAAEVSGAVSAHGLLSAHFPGPGAEKTEAVPPPSGAGQADGPSGVVRPALASSSGSGRAYWVSVARIGAQVADALAFAHAHGIVHRDVKPSNLLLDPQGTVWVTDFGLAKAAADPENLTHSGDVVGTLRYMAPERFLGKSDARSDLYSLGITLYELLTFRGPFGATDRNQLLHQVLHEEPPRPRRVNPEIPRDLETIVLKAIAKEPAHRYPTAAELAEDLRRFVDDRPVRARRLTAPQRLWRWARREPRTAALLAALLLALVGGLAGVATQWRRAEGKAHDEADARRAAEQAQDEAREGLYLSQVAQARLEWRLNNVAGAQQLLDTCESDRRGWEWRYLRGVNRSELFDQRNDETDYVLSVAFSPDGRLLAFAGFNPYTNPGHLPSPVEVWDVRTGRHGRTLMAPGWGLRVAFSPDGRLLAVGSDKGARVWDLASGKQVHGWDQPGTVAFSPDGRRLAISGAGALRLADVATGAAAPPFASGGGRVAFRPDGRVLAVSGPDAIALRDATTGAEVGRLPYEAGRPADDFARDPEAAFSPDGKLLVAATTPPQVWDVADPARGRLLHALAGHEGAVLGAAFGPDGRYLATAGADSTVRLWDASSGAERAVLRGHTHWAGCVAFHPDGWCLASGGRQPGDVKLWDLTHDPDHLTLRDTGAQALGFDPADGRLQLVTSGGRLQSRDPWGGQTREGRRVDLVDIGRQWASPVNIAAYSADCRLLAGISGDRRTVKVWRVADGHEVAALPDLAHVPILTAHVALSPDGRRVAATGWPGRQAGLPRELRVWDVAAGQVLARFRSVTADGLLQGAVAFSPDGARVAFDDYRLPAPGETKAVEARVRVCEAVGGRELLPPLPAGDGALTCLAFSPDGRLLAAGGRTEHVFLWDAVTGRRLHALDVDGQPYRLAFSPDGRRLAAVDREQVKVWDVAVGKEVLTLRGAPPRPSDGGFNPCLAWSPDGRWLAATRWDGSVAVWDGGPAEPAGPGAVREVPAARRFAWHLDEAEAALRADQRAAATFHLARVPDEEAPDYPSRERRALLLAHAREWDEAAAALAGVFAGHDPDSAGIWLEYARVLLLRGDAPGYRRLCDRIRARLRDDPPLFAEVVAARMCGLAPGATADPATDLVCLAAQARVLGRGDAGTLLSLGLAYYRAGEWDEALELMRQFAEALPPSDWQTWPVRALIHQRQGHTAEARRWLDKAAAYRHEQTARAGESAGFVPDGNWADFLILDAEADALVNGGKP